MLYIFFGFLRVVFVSKILVDGRDSFEAIFFRSGLFCRGIDSVL